MAADWRVEAENGKMEESESKIALLLSHFTGLLATCIAHQEDIHSLDDAIQTHNRAFDQVNSHVEQLQQLPVTAPDASSSNTSDRLNALEIDVRTLKDDVQLQRIATQQLEQQICAATANPSSTPRETTPKFDDQEIFCDLTKTDPIPWFCKFVLKLQLHHVSEDKHHAYLYSRSEGACQAWLDNLLSKYGVVAADLYAKFIDIFELPTGVVPDWPISHEIILEAGVVSPKGYIYRKSEDKLTVLRSQLDDLLDKGWIHPSSSPYGVSVLFVRKKNKDLRSCIDYRKLNAQTVKNAGPLPRINDLVERLGGAKYFSKLDLKSGYYQISIRPNDRYKSAFKTRYGHFEWVVMPFGLTNAPTTFQAAMTNEFCAMLDRFVLVYLEDILVYSRTLEDYIEHLRRVLETLRRAKFKANHDKCGFVREELEYLDHFVTPKGISPLSDKIQAIQEWSEPRDTRRLRPT
ncbi:hypothetical protein CBR_g185 [Chara braunii]|uniref:Reverse transcriptase domain-containing protein n=1 Tax=Chara braunii TaxID=69332 RepID=A0A388JM23_CHABU|nr:hypothetical protein CBR_g185 [Chara braunii]|eukprot:GBG58785.1 hypothetical protein CBR_g185 [Chara braunii]